jgi:hypothetical protein
MSSDHVTTLFGCSLSSSHSQEKECDLREATSLEVDFIPAGLAGATEQENAIPSRDREGAVEEISWAHPSLTVGARISVIFRGEKLLVCLHLPCRPNGRVQTDKLKLSSRGSGRVLWPEISRAHSRL